MYIIVNVYKQSLISGGSQLSNADGVKIPLGSGLPVGNGFINVWFHQCMVHEIWILKKNLYLF